MRRRLLVALGLVLTVSGIVLSAGGAYAYVWNRDHEDAIAHGVTIAGIDVGGLHAPAARALLEQRLGAQLRRPVTITAGSHTFTVDPSKAGLRVDLDRMVDEAVAVSRHGGLVRRLYRDVRHRLLRHEVALRAALSRDRVGRVADGIAATLDRPAKNAEVVRDASPTGSPPRSTGRRRTPRSCRSRSQPG